MLRAGLAISSPRTCRCRLHMDRHNRARSEQRTASGMNVRPVIDLMLDHPETGDYLLRAANETTAERDAKRSGSAASDTIEYRPALAQ
jgi:hypothetical protein